jgi:hypothetical protein
VYGGNPDPGLNSSTGNATIFVIRSTIYFSAVVDSLMDRKDSMVIFR